MYKASFISFSLLLNLAVAQSNDELYQNGLECRKNYKIQEGFDIFSKLMKADSSNSMYIAYGRYFYSRVRAQQKSDAEKMKYYKKAEYLSRKAIKLDDQNPEAHYAYALALGRINENASSSEKIKNSKLIKKEADRTIALEPKHAGAYHILGRWHRTIAGFNAMEKAMINTFYGGVPPGGSYEESAKAFQNAIVHEPDYILHFYELGLTYHEMGKDSFARGFLEKALKLPNKTPEDEENKRKCSDLLKKLKG